MGVSWVPSPKGKTRGREKRGTLGNKMGVSWVPSPKGFIHMIFVTCPVVNPVIMDTVLAGSDKWTQYVRRSPS